METVKESDHGLTVGDNIEIDFGYERPSLAKKIGKYFYGMRPVYYALGFVF
jgi:hypothetical protein